jgi:hypothetical protein
MGMPFNALTHTASLLSYTARLTNLTHSHTQPADFNEVFIRKSPTYIKWTTLEGGHRLRYACREFVKGHKDDEERLMRRIMIARRNNIRDHETLKKARKMQKRPVDESRRRKAPLIVNDLQVEREMDVSAVEATRSYKQWMHMQPGDEFVYNQRYVKGKEGHDWLLKKNIWRRMRYRRENKRMVERLRTTGESDSLGDASTDGGGGEQHSHAHHLPHHHHDHPNDYMESNHSNPSAEEAAAAAAAASTDGHLADQAAIEAAVAVAENFGKTDLPTSAPSHVADHHHHHHQHHANSGSSLMVHDPLQAAAAEAALDAAAKLAAVTDLKSDDDDDDVTGRLLLDDDDEAVEGVVIV